MNEVNYTVRSKESIPVIEHKLLDHGYLKYVEHWGSDERIIEAARMSTDKGFLGWEPEWKCPKCKAVWYGHRVESNGWCDFKPACSRNGCLNTVMEKQHGGDMKLLRYLWENKHATPFEMAGLVVEVQAPIMVFREWHRHRTQCLSGDTLVHFDHPSSVREGYHTVAKDLE
jgi:thymidylate synthase ThyX